MQTGRKTKNPSWIDENNEYNTILDIPVQWKEMFDTIDLSNVQSFLTEELDTLGDHIPMYPPKNLVFNAFNLTPPDKLKVVILGQDPYINEGEAMGLAFSVPEGKKIPPSLRNILKKLNKYDKANSNGDLTHWANQGVLLLNTALTVRAHSSNSHSAQWRPITDAMIKYLSEHFDNLIFVLWGGNAFKKKEWIDDNKHSVLISSHPSPLGCSKPMKGNQSFNECDHFNECNRLLEEKGECKIVF
tara:strand:+ start:5585 stop:6316 length:732 start_codon:yes stop_codon:yes gene_type:complete